MTSKKTIFEHVSIILPAKNEAHNIERLLQELLEKYPDAEIILVNDGSTDNTETIAKKLAIKVVSHPYSLGNGAAIKTGARVAQGDIFVFMDADGQHQAKDIEKLMIKFEEGYDMVIGSRDFHAQASTLRFLANTFYNKLASIMTGYKIQDLTSGFRVTRARHFKKFLYLLPNGFSYPTTSTMAFFRSGFPIAYVPIATEKRRGKSNISLFKDGLRFLLIIIKIGTLFSPMRLFLPISLFLFSLGLSYYAYTFLSEHRFTNMSALLLTSSLLVFLIGIISEQISSLHYKHASDDARRTKR
ncbi:MAG: glycosyltransferase family 2 protein [Thiohalomonadales bacterium]